MCLHLQSANFPSECIKRNIKSRFNLAVYKRKALVLSSWQVYGLLNKVLSLPVLIRRNTKSWNSEFLNFHQSLKCVFHSTWFMMWVQARYKKHRQVFDFFSWLLLPNKINCSYITFLSIRPPNPHTRSFRYILIKDNKQHKCILFSSYAQFNDIWSPFHLRLVIAKWVEIL